MEGEESFSTVLPLLEKFDLGDVCRAMSAVVLGVLIFRNWVRKAWVTGSHFAIIDAIFVFGHRASDNLHFLSRNAILWIHLIMADSEWSGFQSHVWSGDIISYGSYPRCYIKYCWQEYITPRIRLYLDCISFMTTLDNHTYTYSLPSRD